MTEREGKPSYKLEDGREFKSPSAAGTAITGGACNGWAFWSLETAHDAKPDDTLAEVTTTSEPDAPQENEPTVNIEVKPEEVQKSGTYRMKNQKGSPEGQGTMVLLRLRRAFLSAENRETRRLPQRPQEIKANRTNPRTSSQKWGLVFLGLPKVTIPLTITRGNQW